MDKRLKIILFFFLVMLLFTFISRGVTSALTPKVTVEKVAEKVIAQKISSEGAVNFKEEMPITSIPNLLIRTINVTEGQEINQGETLFTLELSEINKKIESVQREKEKLELQNQQTASEEAAADETRLRNIERAKAAYNEAEKFGTSEINRALADIAATNQLINELNSSSSSYQEEKRQLETLLIQQQTIYEQALETKEKSLNEAQRAIDQASDPTGISTQTAQIQKDIEEKNAELDRLNQLVKENGEVKAAFAGVVTKLPLRSGDLTTEGAILYMTDPAAGLRLSAVFSKEEQKYFTLGTEVQLSRIAVSQEGNRQKIPNQSILSISANELDDSLIDVTIDLPAENVKLGEFLKVEINVSSQKYETCIPIEALHVGAGNNYFVYGVAKKNGIMGTESVVTKITVDLLDRNNQYAAVSGLTMGEEVIVTMDKAIDEHIKVKIDG